MAEEPSPETNATPPACEQKRRGRKKREREKKRGTGTGEKKKEYKEDNVRISVLW